MLQQLFVDTVATYCNLPADFPSVRRAFNKFRQLNAANLYDTGVDVHEELGNNPESVAWCKRKLEDYLWREFQLLYELPQWRPPLSAAESLETAGFRIPFGPVGCLTHRVQGSSSEAVCRKYIRSFLKVHPDCFRQLRQPASSSMTAVPFGADVEATGVRYSVSLWNSPRPKCAARLESGARLDFSWLQLVQTLQFYSQLESGALPVLASALPSHVRLFLVQTQSVNEEDYAAWCWHNKLDRVSTRTFRRMLREVSGVVHIRD